MKQIKIGDSVTINYTCIDNNTNAILDSSYERNEPLTFICGDDSIIIGLSQALVGCTTGDKKEVVLEAESAYGAHNPNLVLLDKVENFAMGTDVLERVFNENLALETMMGEDVLVGYVTNLTKDTYTVDFNHPLAGKSLKFMFEVL